VTDGQRQSREAHDAWPPARVHLRTPRLELRLPGEDELARLAGVAAGGVHASGSQPFDIPWGTQPPGLRARSVLQWHWATRGTWAPGRWTLDFAVFLDGQPVGVQGLSAVDFRVRREVASGSWLGQPYQRRGLGKEMRAAVLVLAFAHLGALSAVTGAYADNSSSIKVSKALGYHDDGQQVADRDGNRVLAHRFRLTAPVDMQHWPPVTVTGIDEEFLHMCAAKDPAGHQALSLGGYSHA
jgi:RimJ/RimL family protein N-acetyltransferase